ncbi:MAG: hypothetical protein ACRENS_09155, partial [Candidatus Eiseniibacteriota bacterium]
MNVRSVGVVLLVVVAFLAGVLWMRQTSQPSSSASGSMPPAAPGDAGGASGGQVMPPAEPGDPGLAWTLPKRWKQGAERPMRFATFEIPATAGDKDNAECAVFYFGPSQGGTVDANISRWIDQFEAIDSPQRSVRSVAGMNVSVVKVNGTFLAPMGPKMESQGKKTGYSLLGAIAEGPHGMVFFKLTGPKKTV